MAQRQPRKAKPRPEAAFPYSRQAFHSKDLQDCIPLQAAQNLSTETVLRIRGSSLLHNFFQNYFPQNTNPRVALTDQVI